MVDVRMIDRVDEIPVFFDVGADTLFGIMSFPIGDPIGKGVLLAPGGGTPSSSMERNRVYVALARALAGLGFHVFRFEWHGVGESTGRVLGFRLDEPFDDELVGAAKVLRSEGIEDLTIVGSCFGARTALAAFRQIPGIRALVLISPPTRDFALSERQTAGWRIRDYALALVRPRRLVGGDDRLTPRRYVRYLSSGLRVALRRVRARIAGSREGLDWVSHAFVKGLSSVVKRGVPALVLYGAGDDEYQDFIDAQRGSVGRIVASGGRQLQIVVVPGKVHGFTRLEGQERAIRVTTDWVARVVGLQPPVPPQATQAQPPIGIPTSPGPHS